MSTSWGICGAGKISYDFVKALLALPAEEHSIIAVAARDFNKAQEFANKFGATTAYGSYEELSKDPSVEVVYIGVINPYHFTTASMMISAGKHVLCEKPLCMNVRETQELISLAREKNVFLMEAVWSRCFPVYKNMMKCIKDGEIGDIIQVFANFGINIGPVPRVSKKELGGGVTLDIGIYPLQLAAYVMGGAKPLKVLAGGHLNDDGVDETTNVTLVYSEGRVATLIATKCCNLSCEAQVIGTKGTIKVHNPFWCPDTFESPSGLHKMPLPETGGQFNFINSAGLMYEAAEVRECLKKGLKESPSMTLEETLQLATLMEDVRKQLGVVYPQDLI